MDQNNRRKKRKRSRKEGVPSAKTTSVSSETTDTNVSAVPSSQKEVPTKKFLSKKDGEIFESTLRNGYSTFSLIRSNDIETDFHEDAKSTLERLRDAGFYHYDIVQAGGKVLSRTFVKRTIVGEPGMTYKYLGLRLFCHPWSGDDSTPLFRDVRRMNTAIIRLTQQQQHKLNNSKNGSCSYNLTLINYMEPPSQVELRNETQYGMGQSSVSWHADSSLQDNSCIGVYSMQPTQKKKHHTGSSSSGWDWKIALRPHRDNPHHSTLLPIVIPTAPGDAYCLLNECNDQYEHLVLAGDTTTTCRISTTHRVAVTTHDTYAYISGRVSAALVAAKEEMGQPTSSSAASPAAIHDCNVHVLLETQAVLTELEFEWIAQYWIQGAEYDRQHVYWQSKMRALEKAWNSLEKLTARIVEAVLLEAEMQTPKQTGSSLLLKGLLEALEARQALRVKWDERRADKVYKRRVARPYQPVERPIFPDNTSKRKKTPRLAKDLSATIKTLSALLEY